MRRPVARCLLLLLLALACSGERRRAGPAGDERPNVILVSIDTLRADHLGCYGYERPTSPFLDELASEGVLFEWAFAQSSWTLPSHMSLLTSRYPHSHGVESDDRALPREITTLAQALQGAGYETEAFVSWIYVAARFGFDRGFDRFEELLPPLELQDSTTRHSIKAGPFVDRVVGWAEGRRAERPFFLFLHLFDPHIDYEPPLEHARRFGADAEDLEAGSYLSLRRYIRGLQAETPPVPPRTLEAVTALYDGEIHYTDSELRRLFDALAARGLLDDTLVVVTSDHGEEFADHGSMEGHQWTLYDEVIRVPLILRFPTGEAAGRRVAELAQGIDVAPTILDYAGVEAPAGFEGTSLLPLLRGASPAAGAPRFGFSQTRRFNNKWALRTAKHKLIYTMDSGSNFFGVPVTPGYELYDLERDPRERRNLYDPASPVFLELSALLREWVATGKAWRRDGEAPQLTPEERERLRSVGYVDGGG